MRRMKKRRIARYCFKEGRVAPLGPMPRCLRFRHWRRVVLPLESSRTKTSSPPSASAATRFVADEVKATASPFWLMVGR